jgi:hypothetical protein
MTYKIAIKQIFFVVKVNADNIEGGKEKEKEMEEIQRRIPSVIVFCEITNPLFARLTA